jgi:hypothetical protein
VEPLSGVADQPGTAQALHPLLEAAGLIVGDGRETGVGHPAGLVEQVAHGDPA